jgi:hypothetical protein
MKALVLLFSADLMGRFSFVPKDEAAPMARKALAERQYKPVAVIDVPDTMTPTDAAEEVFDLTNNPNRQEERVEKYGVLRSLSVGDIVKVGDTHVLCCSVGWQVI